VPKPAEPAKLRDKALIRLRPAVRAFLSLFFRVRAHGLEHLPLKSSFVILAKHQRWEDIPILGVTVPRPLYYVAKAELFRPALFGFILSSLGGIPLNRDRPLESRRSLRGIIEHLKSGEGVVIFPEGTYYRGRMGPPRMGLVRMVLSKTSPPFVPVGIRYGKGLRKYVDIRFGVPVRAEVGMEARRFLDGMMKEIGRLSGF